MNATLFELIAAHRAAELLREAESERLARIARPRGGSGSRTLAAILQTLRHRQRPGQPVAPVPC